MGFTILCPPHAIAWLPPAFMRLPAMGFFPPGFQIRWASQFFGRLTQLLDRLSVTRGLPIGLFELPARGFGRWVGGPFELGIFNIFNYLSLLFEGLRLDSDSSFFVVGPNK